MTCDLSTGREYLQRQRLAVEHRQHQLYPQQECDFHDRCRDRKLTHRYDESNLR